MSNVKDIQITGHVPFNWLAYDSPLTDNDAGFIASWFLSPAVGLEIRFTPSGYRPNSNGGQTAMYGFDVTGQEAIAYPAIDRFCRLVEAAGGDITRKQVIDLEDRG